MTSNLAGLQPHLTSIESITDAIFDSRQPYSAYAVHLTTLSPPAIIGEFLLFWLLWKTVESWPAHQQQWALVCLSLWMILSKFSKNLGHYVRNPVDVLLIPVSIFFGWFHGLIKLHAMLTLDVVSNPDSSQYQGQCLAPCHQTL